MFNKFNTDTRPQITSDKITFCQLQSWKTSLNQSTEVLWSLSPGQADKNQKLLQQQQNRPA